MCSKAEYTVLRSLLDVAISHLQRRLAPDEFRAEHTGVATALNARFALFPFLCDGVFKLHDKMQERDRIGVNKRKVFEGAHG